MAKHLELFLLERVFSCQSERTCPQCIAVICTSTLMGPTDKVTIGKTV